MKKKLAIVMAAIMTLAPMNLFAASNNSTTKSATPNVLGLLFMESAWDETKLVDLKDRTDANDPKSLDYFKKAVAGGELKIVLKDDVRAGDQIKIELENADWFFNNKGNATSDMQTYTSFAALNITGIPAQRHDSNRSFKSELLNAFDRITVGNKILQVKGVSGTTYDHTKGYFTTANGVSMYVRATADKLDMPYTLRFSATGNEAVLTFLQAGKADDTVLVPLVSLSRDDGDVRVKIMDTSLTTVSTANIQYAYATSSATKTIVKTVEEARSEFNIDQLIIQESKIGSIKNSGDKDILISAPNGFSFVGGNSATVTFEPGLDSTGGSTIGYENTKYNDVLVLRLKGIVPSSNLTGKVVITGLRLVAEEDAVFGDVNLKISGGDGVTAESFKAAVRKDWTIDFKTTTTVPTLVNGRYVATGGEQDGESQDSSKARDEEHLAAQISFAENSVAAWWADRVTTFELSKGAKFRKVEIKDQKNISDPADNRSNKVDGIYVPDGKILDKTNVKVESTKITINNLYKVKDKKASFVMKMWLSIESGVEGDVTLTATGSAIPPTSSPLSVVVAKAVSPITIDTKITDVKIGYQWQKVADFTITETAPGMLQRTKTVVIGLDDEITGSDGIAFAPDSSAEVIGSWKLTDFESENGIIRFNVDRSSSDKAGSVKFTNLNVKIDRTVPESNKVPYKLIVGGSAVSQNYHAKNDNGVRTYSYLPTNEKTDYKTVTALKFDKFTTTGIKADYLKVITTATNEPGSFTTVVKVTIGDPVIKVGQNTMTMDTAAFIDAASASTMVPVRFIAQGLGIPENQIIWSDAARTVTIMTGMRTVQFKIGSSEILVNGAAFTMTSEEGFPVKALIVEEKEGRSFIPFRALGDALGVTVGWDDATKTATYNNDLTVK